VTNDGLYLGCRTGRARRSAPLATKARGRSSFEIHLLLFVWPYGSAMLGKVKIMFSITGELRIVDEASSLPLVAYHDPFS
jgi:hypothetical protein